MMARLALVALLAGWPATHAATVPALFSAGNAAFASGQYEQAIDFYSQALDLGEAPPAVYYNLGCALFAAKRLGEAVLAFERAKLYSPRFADLNHNLDVIRGQFLADQDLVKPPAGVRGALARFLEGLTENEWIALVVLWFWSAVGCLWLRWMMERPLARLLSLYGFLTAGFLFVCAGGLCAVKLGENRPETRAIVLAAELAVQQSPGGREDTLFRLHAGSPVRVEDRRGGWLFIRLPNGAAGWAPEDALGFVRPRDRKRAEEFLLKTQTMTGKEH